MYDDFWVLKEDGFRPYRIEYTMSGGVIYARNIRHIDGNIRGRVIIPSLLNAHTHLGDGDIYSTIKDDELVLDLEKLVGPGGIKHRYLDKMGEGISATIRRGLEIARRTLSSEIWDFREGGTRGLDYLDKARVDGITVRAFGRPTGDDTAAVVKRADGISISAFYDVDDAFVSEIAQAAREAGKPLAVHFSERMREDPELLRRYDVSVAVHLTKSTEEDIMSIVEMGVFPVLCISSNILYGSMPPVAQIVANGIPFGLGTDNFMLSPPSMPQEIYRAWTLRSMLGVELKPWEYARELLLAATYYPRRHGPFNSTPWTWYLLPQRVHSPYLATVVAFGDDMHTGSLGRVNMDAVEMSVL